MNCQMPTFVLEITIDKFTSQPKLLPALSNQLLSEEKKQEEIAMSILVFYIEHKDVYLLLST